MTKEAMITYNTLHSAKKNKMVRTVDRLEGGLGCPHLGQEMTQGFPRKLGS